MGSEVRDIKRVQADLVTQLRKPQIHRTQGGLSELPEYITLSKHYQDYSSRLPTESAQHANSNKQYVLWSYFLQDGILLMVGTNLSIPVTCSALRIIVQRRANFVVGKIMSNA